LRAERANEAKDEFLALLGHELRNPLAAIRSAAEVMRLASSNPSLVERTQNVIERQTAQMAHLLDDLLDVSRIARGKIEIAKEPVELRQILQEILHDRADQLASAGLELAASLGRDPIWIEGDRVRLTQIFDNLLANSSKFTPAPGTIAVTLR